MEWIPKILIAIAASNTFGAINYYLKGVGITIGHHSVIKIFILFSAYLIAIIAYKPNSIAIVFGYLFLVLGLISAILAIYTGINVGVTFTLVFGFIWLIAFSYGLYLFNRHNKNIA
jgi:hypothetical protein